MWFRTLSSRAQGRRIPFAVTCGTRHISLTRQQLPTKTSGKATLVEEVLGFDAIGTSQFAQVLKGTASPLHAVTMPTVEEELRKRKEQRSHKSSMSSPQSARTEREGHPLTAALVELFNCDGALASAFPQWHDIFSEAVRLRCLSENGSASGAEMEQMKASCAAAMLGHAAASISALSPVDLSATSAKELPTALISHKLLVEAVVAMTLDQATRPVKKGDRKDSLPDVTEWGGLVDSFLVAATKTEPSVSHCYDVYWASITATSLVAVQANVGTVFSTNAGRADALDNILEQRAQTILKWVNGKQRRGVSMDRGQANVLQQLHASLLTSHKLLAMIRQSGVTAGVGETKSSSVILQRQFLLLVHAIWMLDGVTSVLSPDYLERSADLAGALRLVSKTMRTCEPGLTEQLLLPGIGPSRAEDHAITHRTVHSSLNISLDSLRKELAKRAVKPYRVRQHLVFHQHPGAARDLVAACAALMQACRTTINANSKLATSSPAFWSIVAVTARLSMNVETQLSLVSSVVLGLEWKVPTQLKAVGSPKGSSIGEVATEKLQWLALLEQCDDLRLRCAQVANEGFRHLVQEELAKDRTKSESSGKEVRRGSPSQHFISAMKTPFAAMGRRHYLATQGFTRGTNAQMHRDVTRHYLEVFLLMRSSASLARQEAAQRGARRGGGLFQTCGTSLTVAAEVAFFLSLYLNALSSSTTSTHNLDTSAEVTVAAAEAYIAEVFHQLGHNTTKQLRHLRSRETLHYFTGEKRGKTELITEEHVWRRHVSSTLATVTAHTVHPSFLWMPLWQVQEMVYLFEHHTRLFYDEAHAVGEGGGDVGGQHSGATRAKGSLDAFAATVAESATKRGKSGGEGERRSPNFTRAKVSVNDCDTDLSIAHEYLVQRIYVVSNVLRAYRDVVSEAWTAQQAKHRNKATNSSFAAALASLAVREPANELLVRRERRPWARTIATALLNDFPLLPAETEGVTTASSAHAGARLKPNRLASLGAALRVIARDERTVQRCLASHLLFNTIDEKKRKIQASRVSQETAVADKEKQFADAPLTREDRCELHLSRPATDAPLGFILDAVTARVRRIVGVDEDCAEGAFALAARESAGLPAAALVGWRVTAVDGVSVTSGTAVGALLKGKLSLQLSLCKD